MFPAELVTFTKEILMAKLHFLCAVFIILKTCQFSNFSQLRKLHINVQCKGRRDIFYPGKAG